MGRRRGRGADRTAPADVKASAPRLAVALTVVSLAAACATTPDVFEPLAKPDGMSTTQPTAPPPDPATQSLSVVGGTTTTVMGFGPGPLTLTGRVVGPAGPVPGATVLVERFEGPALVSRRVATGADGVWRLPEVLGGQYRVRAWSVPDMFGRRSTVLFVGAGQEPIVLTVEQLTDQRLEVPTPPGPPILGRETNIVLRVVGSSVSADGRIRSTARPGVLMQLSAVGWEIGSPVDVVTDASGQATWKAVCRSARATISVRLAGKDPVAVDIGACVDPPSAEVVPPTTATTTTTTTTIRR
jgi:hypothetical protein